MPRKRLPNTVQRPAAPSWVVTYGDMMSLLLTFFVLLLSFSTLDNRKIKEVLGSLRGALGVLYRGEEPMSQRTLNMNQDVFSQPATQHYQAKEAAQQIRRTLERNGLKHKLGVRQNEEGIVLTLNDSVLFEPGGAKVTAEGQETLHTVAGLLRGFQSKIRVEGHTDNIPVPEKYTHLFATNWELSTARALSVLHFLVEVEALPEKQFYVAGYADTRPTHSNYFAVGRAQNRRVDIVLVADKDADGEGLTIGWLPIPKDSEIEPL